jgi:hypothetical protein
LDPSLLDDDYNWIGFILDDDIVGDGYIRAVFVKDTDDGLEAGVYGPGRGGPDPQRFIESADVEITGPDTLDVTITSRQYAAFHEWFAQTSFETIGADDRGFPECNWEAPPPRPTPIMGKCLDESDPVFPTVDESPSPTHSSTPSDPPCAFRQSQCQRNYITIHRGEHSFYGVVRHRKDVCERARKVVLRNSETGETEGRDKSDGEGKWRIRLDDAPDSYFAVAKEMSIVTSHGGGDVTCRRERSITSEG